MYYLLYKEMSFLATLTSMSFFKRSGTYNLYSFGRAGYKKATVVRCEAVLLKSFVFAFYENAMNIELIPDNGTDIHSVTLSNITILLFIKYFITYNNEHKTNIANDKKLICKPILKQKPMKVS